jgi:hypothetical protein
VAAFTAAAVSLIHAAMIDTAPAASPVEDTAKILGALPLFARLDPASLADGRYQAKLVASDEESNPPNLARKSELNWVNARAMPCRIASA